MEQLRQQQVELAKAPGVEATVSIPEAAVVEAPTPAAQAEQPPLAPSPPEGTTPLITEGEGGEVPVRTGTEGAEVQQQQQQVPETKARTDEAAAEGQSVTLSVQDGGRDSEESRKRRESMRNNAEQVC